MDRRRTLVVIGVASGAGAPDPGCADGPDALRAAQAFRDAPLQRIQWDGILRAVPTVPALAPRDAITALNSDLAGKVAAVLDAGNFPLVVGGDHACAIGTWSGVRRARGASGPVGLIWVDAHMDSHTFATTPSGQIHGMPLACLLGHGDAGLCALDGPGATLRPEHVCLIGVRSYEPGEAALLQRLGVRVFDMDEVRRRGLAAVFGAALAIVRRGTAAFGVSVDLDALDPEDGPGVGCPVPGGLGRAELAAGLSTLGDDPAFVAMEIAEYNPHRDRGGTTAAAAGALVDAIAPRPFRNRAASKAV